MNTKFRVLSNEKRKRERVNGFLAVDGRTGINYFMSVDKACYEVVADFLYKLAVDRKKAGCHLLRVYLDNNSTHKARMREMLFERLSNSPDLEEFQLVIEYMPPYSPDFNLAEYLIRLVRQKLLHHLPSKLTLPEIEQKLSNFFREKQLQTPEQIKNIINHILKLGGIQNPIGSEI